MKVIHLTSVHNAFDSRIFHKECKTLAAAGHEVVLVAPGDRSEEVKGVKIRAVAAAKSRQERLLHTMLEVWRAALDEDGQVYHFHDPELILLGILLRLRGKCVIYDVHEDVPLQVRSKHWIPKPFRSVVAGVVRGCEWLAGNCLSGIVAATPQIARKFPAKKTVVVQNFPILDELHGPSVVVYSGRPQVIGYVGSITLVRGIREMVLAMERLPESAVCRLALAGDFSPPLLEDQVSQMPGWKRVDYLGWQSREGVRTVLESMRIGLVVLHPIPNYLEAYPVKLFEYMAAGIPVIASDFPVWREIVAGSDCGLLVDPLNPQAITDAIAWLLQHPEDAGKMGARGREAVNRQYNWQSEAKKLQSFYDQVAEPQVSRGGGTPE